MSAPIGGEIVKKSFRFTRHADGTTQGTTRGVFHHHCWRRRGHQRSQLSAAGMTIRDFKGW